MKNWIRKLGVWTAGRVSVLIFTVFLYPGDATASLDLAFRGTGLILGNSHEEGKTIHGLNLTIGVPEKLPFEKINGISLGLLGPYANEFNGIAAGLLYVHGYPEGIIRGLAFGGLAVDAEEIWGAAFSGGPMVYDRFRGIALGFLGMGGLARSSESIIGLAVNGIWIEADEFKGIGFALAHAIAKKEMTGLMIGVVRTDIGRVNGVAVGGGMMN
ncbi:MAG TPA: hypothetical protein VLB09_03110, partial [Nitrospiria bacterium]|nr:hypothetical protein [Nitrospiria bacterium]